MPSQPPQSAYVRAVVGKGCYSPAVSVATAIDPACAGCCCTSTHLLTHARTYSTYSTYNHRTQVWKSSR